MPKKFLAVLTKAANAMGIITQDPPKQKRVRYQTLLGAHVCLLLIQDYYEIWRYTVWA